MIQTLDDIIEWLADQLRIYGAHVEGERLACRCCWTATIKRQILDAVEVERKLSGT